MTVTVDEFEVADPADAWTPSRVLVDSDAVCRIGGFASGSRRGRVDAALR